MRSPTLYLAILLCAGTLLGYATLRQPAPEAPVVAKLSAAPEQPLVADIPAFATWPEFRLVDLFKRPLGPRGLEYSDSARELDGKQVRVLGFCASTDWADKTTLLLSSMPVILHEKEYNQADDFPSGVLFVKMPEGEKARFTSGLLMLAGTLQLGRFEEPNGRISYARLVLDPRSKHWEPSPSLLSHYTPEQRDTLKMLVRQQKRCGCSKCAA